MTQKGREEKARDIGGGDTITQARGQSEKMKQGAVGGRWGMMSGACRLGPGVGDGEQTARVSRRRGAVGRRRGGRCK